MARLDAEAKDAVTAQRNGKAVESVQDAGKYVPRTGLTWRKGTCTQNKAEAWAQAKSGLCRHLGRGSVRRAT